MAIDYTRKRDELFVVRIWTEPTQYAATWRASVTHVATRECRFILGYGRDYHYAHDDYSIKQFNLPENLRGHTYFEPDEPKGEPGKD